MVLYGRILTMLSDLVPTCPFRRSRPTFFYGGTTSSVVSVFLQILYYGIRGPGFSYVFGIRTRFRRRVPRIRVRSERLLRVYGVRVLMRSLPLTFCTFFMIYTMNYGLRMVVVVLRGVRYFFFEDLPRYSTFFFRILGRLFNQGR